MIKHLMMKFEVNVGITWIVTMIRIIANSIFKWDTLFFMMTVSHGLAGNCIVVVNIPVNKK